MPYIQNFTATQQVGLPKIITVVDNSTGSDAAVTQRRIYLIKADGTYLVPTGTTTDYISFPIGSSTIDINVLVKDMALNIMVQWLNVSGTVLYTKTSLFGFTLFSESYLYTLTQAQSSNPIIVQDLNYIGNKYSLREAIDSGNQAIALAGDITSAQECYDTANYLWNNASKFF